METMFLPKTLADMAFMKMGGTIGNSSILDRADFQRCFGGVYNPCASADTPEHIPARALYYTDIPSSML